MKKLLRSPGLYLSLLLTLFALAPFWHPGYFWAANDARHDVFFIQQYHLSWQENVLYPRWSPDWAFGYGYPFFNLVAPGATFVGTLLYHVLPITLENAVEGTFMISLLLSAAGMWLFVRDWADERAALLAALVYVYAPYHLLDVYARAAMGESFALALLPFALWRLRRLVRQPSASGMVWLALSYAAIHLTHNFIALLSTGLLAVYALALAWQATPSSLAWRGRLANAVRRLVPAGLGLGLGLGIAAFFVFPALLEFKYVRQDQWFGGYYDFHDHFVYLAQFFDPRWGFGSSVPGPDDPISYQFGLAPFVLALLGLARWWRNRQHMPGEAGFWLLIWLAGAWLSTAAAAWAWDHVPLVASAQFPWRYLSLVIVALAVLAAYVWPLRPAESAGRQWLAALVLGGLVILGSARYVQAPIVDAPTGGATLAGLMEFERSANEMTGMTATADQVATWSPLADLHVAGIAVNNQVDYSLVNSNDKLVVDVQEHRIAYERAWVRALTEGQRVPFYRQWFPGWTATILDPDTGAILDRFALTPEHTRPPYGLLDVPVPAGDHILVLSFEDTPIRRVSKALSALSALLALALLLASRRLTPVMERLFAQGARQ